MRNNIPAELRALPQWVCANENKIPHSPITGAIASVTDPSTWGTFEQACANKNFKHIGFVLSEYGKYTIIDLDNKPEKPLSEHSYLLHERILEHFQSYTERSQSGRGYHIIVRGTIPSGVHRDSVEVYSSKRYMICTGDTVKALPINDYQESLNNMFSQMKEDVDLIDIEATATDAEVVQMAMDAANSEKFNALCNGDINGYPSQSEADLALLSILCFYTRSNDQVKRLFRASALGKREKATKNDTYLNRSLRFIRSSEPPPIEFPIDRVTAVETVETKPINNSVPPPPGLIGRLANYIYNTSVRPVPEVALAGALAFVSGLCSRQYNTTTDSGLNQYIILLAGTGRGKEGARSGVDKLFSAVRQRIPSIELFRGPAAFSSGAAVIKSMGQNPCLLSILGEFGITLQQISAPNASMADKTLFRVLLDLYGQTGFSRTLGLHKYSSSEKDTAAIRAPNLTILGETSPETFFDGLSEDMIMAGLIPRFMCLEYAGDRPYINDNAGFAPPEDIINDVVALAETVIRMQANESCQVVPFDTQATRASHLYDKVTTDRINKERGVVVELWNRAHLKVLKLASLVAVGCNHTNPVVTLEHFDWAKNFVDYGINLLSRRFENNDVGVGDGKQLQLLKKICQQFLNSEDSSLSEQEIKCKAFKAVPKAYLLRRTANLSQFKMDRLGATSALNRALISAEESGYLVPLRNNPTEFVKHGIRIKAFALC